MNKTDYPTRESVVEARVKEMALQQGIDEILHPSRMQTDPEVEAAFVSEKAKIAEATRKFILEKFGK